MPVFVSFILHSILERKHSELLSSTTKPFYFEPIYNDSPVS